MTLKNQNNIWNTKKLLYGFRRKLMMAAMVLALLILIPAAAAICTVVERQTRNQVREQYTYVTEKMYLSFDNIYQGIDAVTGNFVTNEYVQKSLKKKPLDSYEAHLLVRQLALVNNPYSSYYLFVDNKGAVYAQKQVDLDHTHFKKSSLRLGLGDGYSKTRLIWERDTLFGSGEMALFAARYARPMDRDGLPGYVYLRLTPELVEGMTRGIQDSRSVSLLLDSRGQICYERYPQQMERDGRQQKRIISEVAGLQKGVNRDRWSAGLEGESPDPGDAVQVRWTAEGYICARYHEDTGFAVVTFVPEAVVGQVLWQIIAIILMIFAVVMAAAFFIIWYGTGPITRPVIYLSGLMENFDESNFEEMVSLNTNSELDRMGEAYNKMVGRIYGLITEVRYQEEERHKAELDALLYQIHPHFLYNTLDTVYMLARISKEETIMKMVQALSRYLRIILSGGADEIPVSRELEHVKAYLDIQKIRNDELFQFSISCEDELADLRVIKMILQPLAENCIKHGFREMGEGGMIRICVRREEEMAVFTVENNGETMPPKTVERMNRLEGMSVEDIGKPVDSLDPESGYGIGNVVKRLRLRYGDGIRFYYAVKDGVTACVIKVPVSVQEGQDKAKAGEEAV